jgi:hypothetical protein
LSNLFLSGTDGSLCRTHVDAQHTFFLVLKGQVRRPYIGD